MDAEFEIHNLNEQVEKLNKRMEDCEHQSMYTQSGIKNHTDWFGFQN